MPSKCVEKELQNFNRMFVEVWTIVYLQLVVRLLTVRVFFFLVYQKILFIKTDPHNVASVFPLQILITCTLLLIGICWSQKLTFSYVTFLSFSHILFISTYLLGA